jgi:hypothetical protein
MARGRVHAHLGHVGARRLGGEGTDGGARRWPVATAAAARAAVKFGAGKFGSERSGKLTSGGGNGGLRRGWREEEEEMAALNSSLVPR